MVRFNFPVFSEKQPFWANLVQKNLNLNFDDKFSAKEGIFRAKGEKLQFCLGTKFQLKLTILISLTKST